MFKLNPKPTFSHDVSIATPDGPAVISLEFRHQGKKALRQWGTSINNGSDIEVIGHIVTNWFGVVNEAGALVSFTPEALASMLDGYPTAAQEIFVEYMRILKEGRAKN
jgi:hypothetical protein